MSIKVHTFNGSIYIRLIGRVEGGRLGYFPNGEDGRTYGDQPFFDWGTQREVLEPGTFGHLWASDMHVSQMLPDIVTPSQRLTSGIVLLDADDFVGAPPAHNEVEAITPEPPASLGIGFVLHETVGMAIINETAIPQYERDVQVHSTVIRRRTQAIRFSEYDHRLMFNGRISQVNLVDPDEYWMTFVESEETDVPTFEMATNPTIRLADIRTRGAHIAD